MGQAQRNPSPPACRGAAHDRFRSAQPHLRRCPALDAALSVPRSMC